MNIREEKKILRTLMTQERDCVPVEQHTIYSAVVSAKIYALAIEKKCNVVHCYLPFRSEINLLPCLERLINKKIEVICPKTLEGGRMEHLRLSSVDEIKYGLYDVPYPAGNDIYSGPIDLIIVPGLAFDKKGNRLGYGGGYYDRFLATYPEAHKLAVAFPFQLVDQVPVEAFDAPIDEVYFNAL